MGDLWREPIYSICAKLVDIRVCLKHDSQNLELFIKSAILVQFFIFLILNQSYVKKDVSTTQTFKKTDYWESMRRNDNHSTQSGDYVMSIQFFRREQEHCRH